MEDANTRTDPTPKKALFNDSTQKVGRMAFSGLINNSETLRQCPTCGSIIYLDTNPVECL